MKYLEQFVRILAVSLVGELLKSVLPFPVPASIYGLVLLFILLETGILKLEAVKDAAQYLIEIMPLLFIPAGVELLTAWGALRPVLLPVAVIMVVSTVAVMAVSGRVTQFVMRKRERGREK